VTRPWDVCRRTHAGLADFCISRSFRKVHVEHEKTLDTFTWRSSRTNSSKHVVCTFSFFSCATLVMLFPLYLQARQGIEMSRGFGEAQMPVICAHGCFGSRRTQPHPSVIKLTVISVPRKVIELQYQTSDIIVNTLNW
jgi:hypothetical protein